MKRFARRWIWSMAMLPGLLMTAECPASYLVEMKNGTNIVTSQCWEENGQIKYHHLGGIVGVNKGLVLSITDTDAPIPTEIVAEPLPPSAVPKESDPATAPVEATQEESEEFEKKMAKSHEDLTQNHGKSKIYVEKYREAKKQNDKEAMAEAWKILEELQVEQTQLREEVRNRLNGDLPEWWNEVISQ